MKDSDLNFVDREKVQQSKKRSGKFRPLLERLEDLEPGGKAIEVSYSDEKEVNSMRTAVYQFNKEEGIKIRSAKDSQEQNIYFYREDPDNNEQEDEIIN